MELWFRWFSSSIGVIFWRFHVKIFWGVFVFFQALWLLVLFGSVPTKTWFPSSECLGNFFTTLLDRGFGWGACVLGRCWKRLGPWSVGFSRVYLRVNNRCVVFVTWIYTSRSVSRFDMQYKNLKHGIKPQVDYDVGDVSSPSSHSFRKLSKPKIYTKRWIPGDSTQLDSQTLEVTYSLKASRKLTIPKRAQRIARSTFFWKILEVGEVL